jgi:subtilase family serine protease
VSLFAIAGFFGAFYVICQQSGNPDGQPCSLTDFAGYGGTSVASPAFAGILSMVNQKIGGRMGNAGYVLYSLASQQARSGIACNSATGAPASGCIFNDVTTGTIAMPCLKGTPNCTVTNPSDHYGVLSGFSATIGYDFATGLGSVNAANLVNSWTNSTFVSTTTTLALAPSTIVHGGTVAVIADVSSNSGTPTGSVSIGGLAASSPVQSGALASGSYTASLGNLPGGSYRYKPTTPAMGLTPPATRIR